MSRRVLLLLIAGVIAAFTAVSVRNRLAQAPEEVQQTSRVVIARRDLALGTFVQGTQDLDWGNAPVAPAAPAATDDNAPKPEDNTPKENYLHEGMVKLTDFNGAVVRRQLHAGDPVPQSALMKSGEGGFMSAVLDSGKRAMSIAVTATSGNAGFISPGDHVDLIVTHRVKARGQTGANSGTADESVVSETFVHSVRVVAVDQMLDNPDNKAILAKTVTVEVTPRQAEQISVAAEMGKISVVLRSLTNADASANTKKTPDKTSDNDNAHVMTDLYGNTTGDATESSTGNAGGESNDYTIDSDVSSLLDRKQAVAPHVHVIRGDQRETLEFYQDSK